MTTPGPDILDAMRTLRLVVFDFDGVFTDNAVYVDQDGRETVRCTRADGLGLARLREEGVEMMILSTETNPVVTARARKLTIDCEHGCRDKGARLTEIINERGLEPGQVAFVGNDINDAPALRLVGLPIVVADAYDEVATLARWRTDRRGGHGAVREICDTIIGARTHNTSGVTP